MTATVANIYHDVCCPFCGLLCDDLKFDKNLKLSADLQCKKAKDNFSSLPKLHAQGMIQNKTVAVDEAIQKAADLLDQSQVPLFTGLGTDLAGMRGVLKLAQKKGGYIDHMHSNALFNNLQIIYNHGGISTTMSEVRNRADVIVFVGTDSKCYPRFIEKTIATKKTLFHSSPIKRELIIIGEHTKPPKLNDHIKKTVLSCQQNEIATIINALHLLINGNAIDKPDVAGIKLKRLTHVAKLIQGARYGVMVWAADELDFDNADLTIYAAYKMISTLNKTTRFASFNLGGNDGATTAVNANTWQTGYPMRLYFGHQFADYNPARYSTNNIIKRRLHDCLIWLSCFNPNHQAPKSHAPSIVIARPDIQLDDKPDVFIPVGIPGVDHAAHLFRTDQVVALPLKQLRNSELLSSAEVITQIHQRLKSC